MAAQAYMYGGMAALQLVGGYFASQNIKDTAELNRDIAEMNAKYAELDAYDAEIEGISTVTRYQSVIDNTLAEQSAILAAEDVDVNYGSAASLESESRFIGELNKMEIERRTREQVLGIKSQARDIRMGATLAYGDAMTRAGQAMFQSVTGAAQAGLTGYKRSM